MEKKRQQELMNLAQHRFSYFWQVWDKKGMIKGQGFGFMSGIREDDEALKILRRIYKEVLSKHTNGQIKISLRKPDGSFLVKANQRQ